MCDEKVFLQLLMHFGGTEHGIRASFSLWLVTAERAGAVHP